MAPGSSRSAHARAFRFAEALRRAGYTVSVSASGPRGGRRFKLDAFVGSRAGRVYRLKEDRSCSWEHRQVQCDCFDQVDDTQIERLARWHRRLRSTWGRVHGTNDLVPLLLQYDDKTVRVATELYVDSAGHRAPHLSLEEMLTAVQVAMESRPRRSIAPSRRSAPLQPCRARTFPDLRTCRRGSTLPTGGTHIPPSGSLSGPLLLHHIRMTIETTLITDTIQPTMARLRSVSSQ